MKIYGQDLFFTTIGNKKPKGICGSGIIDLIAEMRLNGWVDISGTLNPEASGRVRYLEEEGQYVAVYAEAEESWDGTPLYFTQTDISQYLDTKAAAHTMLDCLLESAGCTAQDISHYYLSGAFLRSWKSGISYYCGDFFRICLRSGLLPSEILRWTEQEHCF